MPQVQVQSEAVAELMGNSGLAATDLVPGEYEGGFKLWEGANDLIGVMLRRWVGSWNPAAEPDATKATTRAAETGPAAVASEAGTAGTNEAEAGTSTEGTGGTAIASACDSALAGQAVLELGCGHGLPGLIALLGGASVVFNVRCCPRRTCICMCSRRAALVSLGTLFSLNKSLVLSGGISDSFR